jgi:hypothetical protein
MIGFSQTSYRTFTGRAVQLRAVTRLADACFANWRLTDNSVMTTSLTLAEYLALRIAGNIIPVNTTGDPGAIWMESWSEPRYSTGVIVAGDVCDWSSGNGLTQLNGLCDDSVVFGEGTNTQFTALATDVVGTTANPGGMTLNGPAKPGRSVVNGTAFLPAGA